jgi:hypothetical protein
MRAYEAGGALLKMKTAHLAPVPLPLPSRGRGARADFHAGDVVGVGRREESIRIEGDDVASMDERIRRVLLAHELMGSLNLEG